jgi:hypothetical protein
VFGKIELSKLENKFLLAATLMIPIVVFATTLFFLTSALSSAVYEYFVPPPKSIIAVGANSHVHPFLVGFRILIALSLTFSGFFIFRKRIFLSTLILLFPIAAIVYRTFYVYATIYREIFGYESQTSFEIFIWTIEFTDTVFLIYILALFFWQISILFRILIKNLQRKSALP